MQSSVLLKLKNYLVEFERKLSSSFVIPLEECGMRSLQSRVCDPVLVIDVEELCGQSPSSLIGLQEEQKLFFIHLADQLDQLNGIEPD